MLGTLDPRGIAAPNIGDESSQKISNKYICKKCNQEFLWSQGNPQELTRVEQMICAKENLPFVLKKKLPVTIAEHKH